MSVASNVVRLMHIRGRCNRTGFVAIGAGAIAAQLALGLVLLSLGIAPDSLVGILLNLPFFWLAFAAIVRRLHDVGHSGWWVVGAIVFSIGWSIAVGFGAANMLDPHHLFPPEPQFFLLVAVVLLPPLAMITWVHAAPSEPRTNRHGAQPLGVGLANLPPSDAGPVGQPA